MPELATVTTTDLNMYLNLLILSRLQSKLSQLILITFDRSCQMESVSFFERGLRGERSKTYPYMMSAKQGSTWYHLWYDAVWDRTHDLPLTKRTLLPLNNRCGLIAITDIICASPLSIRVIRMLNTTFINVRNKKI